MEKQTGVVLRFPQTRKVEIPWEAVIEVVSAEARESAPGDPEDFLAQFGVMLWFERQAQQRRLAKSA